jgi:CheY-like chemotaxis protein
VVDDHEYGRRALSVLLGPLGAEVSTAESGRAALDLLMLEHFDLVLMDVTMTGMDGLETCRALRARHGPNRRTPVIAVTGHAERTHLAACVGAGMNGWVPKPVEPVQLYAAIDKALSEGDEEAEALATA